MRLKSLETLELMAEIAISVQQIHVTDEALAASARMGDRDAFANLMERHRKTAYALAASMLRNPDDAEDAVQEGFVRAYQALHRFRAGETWAPWQMRVMQNVCRDLLRRRSVRDSASLKSSLPDGSPTPEERLLDLDERRILTEHVWKLPEKFRLPILMRYAHQQSYKEIAGALSVPESTVVGRLAGGLRILRRSMKGRET